MELDLASPAVGTQIHIVALPHTKITRQYDYCAYTAKLRRFTHMLVMAGYTPVVYGPDEQDCAPGTIYVPLWGAEDRQRWFGSPDWDADQVFNHWDVAQECWQDTNRRAATAIAAHWASNDILGLIAGACQDPIRTMLAHLHPLTWEWGIGYSGILADSHHTFESYAWAHHVAGLQHHDEIRFYDSVVPNCYDLNDFTPSLIPGDYLLFMGRPTPRKGLPIIAEIAARTDLPVKIAGQPGEPIPGTEYVGLVTGQDKAQLLAGARALLTPTTYLEPFGGVAVEAMLSGTPVIATDWGAMTETVVHGVTGVRCRTLADFMTAVQHVHELDRGAVLAHAAGRYSLQVGATMYAEVIRRLLTLTGDGWYTLP